MLLNLLKVRQINKSNIPQVIMSHDSNNIMVILSSPSGAWQNNDK